MEDKKSPDVPIRQWLKCPNCQWTSFRYRQRSKDYICLHCGALFVADYDEGRVKLIQPPIFTFKKRK